MDEFTKYEREPVKQRISLSPFCVTITRTCFAAQSGGCNCPGTCRKPIDIGDRIYALKLELAMLEGSIKVHSHIIAPDSLP